MQVKFVKRVVWLIPYSTFRIRPKCECTLGIFIVGRISIDIIISLKKRCEKILPSERYPVELGEVGDIEVSIGVCDTDLRFGISCSEIHT